MDHAHERAQLNVRSIKELVDAGLEQVPAPYVRPVQERVHMSGNNTVAEGVPLISLSSPRCHVLQQIATACLDWGIFQVVNHGVSSTLQNQIWSATHNFFALPTNAKLELVPEDPTHPLRFFTGFCKHEKVREWKDTLGFKPSPYTNDNLIPLFLREPMLKFHEQMRILVHKLCEFISSALVDDLEAFQAYLLRESMTFNYYPPCPEPDLIFGLSSHSDFGSLTIIMQDEINGLQVRKEDVWVDVNPIPNSFIVMLGDQFEILTNGHYKSVEHRVVTNQTKPRMSIACFYGPSEHENVKPLDIFVSKDCPMMYKETKFSDYLENGFSRPLNGKDNLRLSRLKCFPSSGND